MTTPQQRFAYDISERVQYAEVRAQRALGTDWITAYSEAWRIMDETYDLAMAPDRPIITLGLRQINGKGKA